MILNESLFSVREIAKLKGVSERTVTFKALEFGITPVAKKSKTTGYLFANYQVEEMFKNVKKKKPIPLENIEVIYVTRTIEIRESKLKFKQLDEL